MTKQVAKSALYRFKKEDGSYLIAAPILKGLVLSGGGARGIAYPGMQQTMVENGSFKNITHIAGASAGAMTGSFMALGCSSKEVELLLTQLNFSNLLDKPTTYSFLARGFRFQNLLEMIYFAKFKQHLSLISMVPMDPKLLDIQNRLKQKVANYQKIFDDLDIKLDTVEDVVILSQNPQKFTLIDNAFRPFYKQYRDSKGELMPSYRFTFKDFEYLRSLLPQSEQHQIKHLSVVSTNITKSTLVVHNVENSPEVSVAQCAQYSGAHPFLFSNGKDTDGNYYSDGALKDNMPSHVLEEFGLSTHEILCVALISDEDLAFRLQVASGVSHHSISFMAQKLDIFFQKIFGTEIHQYFADSYNREKLFYHFGNMLYLNTGDLSITDVQPSQEKKIFAIEQAAKQTQALFEIRNRRFKHPVLAMLFLGELSLKKMIEQTLGTDPELFVYARQVRSIFRHQNEVVRLLATENYDLEEVKQVIERIQDLIKNNISELSQAEQEQALALCYRQISFLSAGKFEDYCLYKINHDPDVVKIELTWYQTILELLFKCFLWLSSSINGLFSKNETGNISQNIENVLKDDSDIIYLCQDAEEKGEQAIITTPIKKEVSITSVERFFKPILEEISSKEKVVSGFGYF